MNSLYCIESEKKLQDTEKKYEECKVCSVSHLNLNKTI